jgi:FSR family fosmidomycin resistance protein-like MFS transporter
VHSASKSSQFGRLGLRWASLVRGQGALVGNALMHLVNDGCFVAFYPVLPLMAAEFDLSYTQVGMLKTVLSGASTAFQLPMAVLAERFGAITFLALGMAWVAVGFMVIGLATSFLQVLCFTFGAGIGGSVQHPVASSFISQEYDGHNRARALGILNFAGDIGKFAVPAVFALSLTLYGWRWSLFSLGAVSLLFAGGFWGAMRHRDRRQRAARRTAPRAEKGWGILHPGTFTSLLCIGVLDASVRNALLTFVPFLLVQKGITEASASLMLTVIFAGGAAGKLGCGLLANRLGITRMIVATEVLTGTFVLLLLPTSRLLLLPLLFWLGFFLNGTSSVLLDGVADLFDSSKRSRGYGLYFTIYLGSGALGPIVYGLFGDVYGLRSVFVVMALASLAIVPLAGLHRRFHRASSQGQELRPETPPM